jgi:PAS domain S-box-containing protein
VGGLSGTVTDSSAFFSFLVEQSPDGQFVLQGGVFTYLNPAALKMFGFQQQDIGRIGFREVLHPSEHERAERNTALRMQGVLRGATTYVARRSDGFTFPIEIHSASWEQAGRSGVHGVIRDITSRKKMEERLERMERSAIVARLASGIAHDFNNLLAIIQTNADLALRQVGDDATRSLLLRIRGAADRGAEKVRHVRQMGGTSAAADVVRPIYLNPVLEDVINLTRARWRDEAESQGIQYELRWNPGLPPPVEASSADLRAALVALVFNALEAMPKGGSLTLRTAEDVDGNAIISVRDEGEGIQPESLGRLTDAFFTTRPDRQMGLGLHLVQTVVQRHGGRMEVDSAPGHGSTFALIFPRSATAPAEAPPAPRVAPALRSSDSATSQPAAISDVAGPRLLLIDDQADLLQVLRTILEGKGYAVDLAMNGKDGIHLLSQQRFALVLTDLGMPDLSGWDVARKVREIQPRTPVVLMTGWAADIDQERLARGSVDAMLPKPFRSERLLEVIEGLLQGLPGRESSPPVGGS